MDPYYYELVATTDQYIDLLESHILDISGQAVECRENSIILRCEEDPSPFRESIIQYVETLQTIFDQKIALEITIEKKANEDWIQKYKEGFEPFFLGRFYIRATWHEEKEGYINIVIDPELSFGTGHHPTTRVCLLAIEKYVQKGDTFLDVGCGSGILSIAAAKLGAEVSLCDIESASIQNATTNLFNNAITPKQLWEGSVSEAPESYDIIVANIVSDILMFLKKDIEQHLKQGGCVILSGILEKYEEKIKKTYASLHLVDRISEGEWVSLIYKKEER